MEKSGQTLRVLDIATGGGDVPIRLSRRAQKAGLNIAFTGVDISATAIAFARVQAERTGAAVKFHQLDALNAALPLDYDVINSSLFLHHLDHTAAADLLCRMGEAARSMVLVNDLIRSRPGYWLAWLGTRVLSASEIVHVDGPRSVEGAFTMAEAKRMAETVGLRGVTVSWRWPFRFLLTWRRTP
jgi:2-polyprenyl-3-methyl-5-hydroxy-6-metoxy-1,4-benzoquinol methylase